MHSFRHIHTQKEKKNAAERLLSPTEELKSVTQQGRGGVMELKKKEKNKINKPDESTYSR